MRRFEHEVQLTSCLTHPNTITIYDYGRTAENIFYYDMELLDGATLQKLVEVSDPQPAGRVVRVLSMACGALSEAHGAGLSHRDIKTPNIMLCSQGEELDVGKLLDFGLVKDTAMKGDVHLTQANTITGTPRYMAPESIRNADAADARSELYALGVVAYFLLAGTELFDGESVVEICSQHLHQVPAPLSTHGLEVPAALEELVMACLDKNPAKRPQSAVELSRRLADCSVDTWGAKEARIWWNKYEKRLSGLPEEG